eukprot:gb/GECH01003466.1/.p1 GENE.gb/GECH01003466.1/~~gb/GECH01003466.1/.p1  ORF type:complete len:376 (+),score=118.73 gb/GECH01003466.1/:1-1128(+)
MQKPKDFQIEGSNIENLGGEEERQARIEAAKTEEQWEGAGKEPGLKIWRIENFQVVAWPEEEYGQFYAGDSYIVLNTYKKEDSDLLHYDVHYWLGEETTQDEAGTAAYKTVELDDLLEGRPVQHREVMGHESSLFLSYFKNPISILQGGVDSGFNKVKPEEYQPRLLHVKGKKNVRVVQKPLQVSSMNSGDVFVLDAGLTVYQFNASKAGPFEKNKASQVVRNIDEQRGYKTTSVVFEQDNLDDGEQEQEFWKLLGGKDEVPEEIPDDEEQKMEKLPTKLFRVSDESGELKFTEEGEGDGKLEKDQLNSDDVHILDTGLDLFIWVGSGSNTSERKNAIKFALNYLSKHDRPLHVPISRIFEGNEPSTFKEKFSSF